ncbi:MAG: endonuclease MutS2 [Anaerolineaceae bacterium]|nr:endonuclease MutS2 [Anaerolineaceae bacterium]
MDEKTISNLEFYKVLEQLKAYAAFSASADLAVKLKPLNDMVQVKMLQKRTTEARLLLSINDSFNVGGVRDIRHLVHRAEQGGVLLSTDFIEIVNTLESSRNLIRKIQKQEEDYPILLEITSHLHPPQGLIETINRVISERGDVLDTASKRLENLRSELKVCHNRLVTKMERYIRNDKTVSMLQESIVTQRNGRYVIPLRSEFKGKIRSIIHDQSSSGATLFVEPLDVVDLNNQWQALQLEERDEIQRVLAELSALIGTHLEHIERMVVKLAEFDLALMSAKYANDLDAVEPIIEPFKVSTSKKESWEVKPGSVVHLLKARHPLLDQSTAVPIDVVLDDKNFSLVITGPNTGGKTVTLKTIGLMAVMAQAGLHIPAQSGSRLSLFNNIYADIGDEQSIEQSLSTFSAHIKNIIRILKFANKRSLVLLDELGSGTDPQEGSALARSVLSFLVNHGITNMVATHFPELKAFAHTTQGTVNSSMEFDLETLLPTYRLNIGLPGRSNGLLISERLGMPEEIIRQARENLGSDALQTDDLLEDILEQRDHANVVRLKAEEDQKEIDRIKAELTDKLEGIEQERISILEDAKEEAESELEEIQKQIRNLKKKVRQSKISLDPIKTVQKEIDSIQKSIKKPVNRASIGVDPSEDSLEIGDQVRLLNFGMNGEIISLGKEDVEVQAGALRMRVSLDDLKRISKRESSRTSNQDGKKIKTFSTSRDAQPIHSSPGVELDLRGKRSEEALVIMDNHLEDAFLSGIPYVRIIHGKGSGKLRKVVQQTLRTHQYVKRFENGLETEGGDGVTVAHIKAD